MPFNTASYNIKRVKLFLEIFVKLKIISKHYKVKLEVQLLNELWIRNVKRKHNIKKF